VTAESLATKATPLASKEGSSAPQKGRPALTRLLYDLRFRAIVYQVVAVTGVIAFGYYLFSNMSTKLSDQNIATGFGFLWRDAGFTISQSLIDYRPSDT